MSRDRIFACAASVEIVGKVFIASCTHIVRCELLRLLDSVRLLWYGSINIGKALRQDALGVNRGDGAVLCAGHRVLCRASLPFLYVHRVRLQKVFPV